MSEIDKLIYGIKEYFGVKTDAELAEKLGVKVSTIGTWKQRKTIPKKVLLQFENIKLAEEQKTNTLTQEFIKHLKQTDPNKDFKNLSELKQRLNTKDTKIIAKLLNITHEEALSYENNPIPKKQQEKAKLIAALIKNSKDTFYDKLNDFAYAKINNANGTQTILSEDKNMAELVYLLLNYSNKAICAKIKDELEKIKNIMES